MRRMIVTNYNGDKKFDFNKTPFLLIRKFESHCTRNESDNWLFSQAFSYFYTPFSVDLTEEGRGYVVLATTCR